MRLLRLDLAEKALLRATGLETSLAIQIAECRNELCVLETRAHPAFLFLSTLNYTYFRFTFLRLQPVFTPVQCVYLPDPREYIADERRVIDNVKIIVLKTHTTCIY